MPNSITLTYFVPHRLAFTGPIPPDTPLLTALKLSSRVEWGSNLGPLSDEAAAAITTISSHLANTGNEVLKSRDCSSLADDLAKNGNEVVKGRDCPSLAGAAPSSWSLQRVFTCQRVVGWSAVLGGGYIMYTTLREGWKARKEMETRGARECEEDGDAGRKWWMVLGGGMYVVGVLVLGIRFEDS